MQSRDEIAEQIIAQAGSIGPERVQKIRELVVEARRTGQIKCTAGSDGAPEGQSPGGELPVERRATSGLAASLERRIEALERANENTGERRLEQHDLSRASSLNRPNDGESGSASEATAADRATPSPASPASVQSYGPGRCEVCGWTLAESREKGCVPGDCSYRPPEHTDEWRKIKARREHLAASVPEWVPSAQDILEAAKAVMGRLGAHPPPYDSQRNLLDQAEAVRRLIASRAPRSVTVEEMAERLYLEHTVECEIQYEWPSLMPEAADYWLALAHAAIGGGECK